MCCYWCSQIPPSGVPWDSQVPSLWSIPHYKVTGTVKSHWITVTLRTLCEMLFLGTHRCHHTLPCSILVSLSVPLLSEINSHSAAAASSVLGCPSTLPPKCRSPPGGDPEPVLRGPAEALGRAGSGCTQLSWKSTQGMWLHKQVSFQLGMGCRGVGVEREPLLSPLRFHSPPPGLLVPWL